MTPPRGLVTGTAAATAIAWGLSLIAPGRSFVSPAVQTGFYLGLFVLTACSRRVKVLLVRTVQRWTINPLTHMLLAIGVNPLGLAILETRGHRSGRARRVPVGNGRMGDEFWIIAEHGLRAAYVRNIQHDPHVRVRLRIGLRYRWVSGIATVRPDDDPLARQRRIVRWHPLRALNAVNVRLLGVDLVTVHVRLVLTDTRVAEHSEKPASPPQRNTSTPSAAGSVGHTLAGRRAQSPIQVASSNRAPEPHRRPRVRAN